MQFSTLTTVVLTLLFTHQISACSPNSPKLLRRVAEAAGTCPPDMHPCEFVQANTPEAAKDQKCRFPTYKLTSKKNGTVVTGDIKNITSVMKSNNISQDTDESVWKKEVLWKA